MHMMSDGQSARLHACESCLVLRTQCSVSLTSPLRRSRPSFASPSMLTRTGHRERWLGRLPAAAGAAERRTAGPTARRPFGTVHTRLGWAWDRSEATVRDIADPPQSLLVVTTNRAGKGLSRTEAKGHHCVLTKARQRGFGKKFCSRRYRAGADRAHRWGQRNAHRLPTGRSQSLQSAHFPPFSAISALRRAWRGTSVTGDVTAAATGSEARAVPAATQSSGRDRLGTWGERLHAGQNK